MPKNTHQGKLIVIEGADGSGKTEAARLLVARLRNCGFTVFEKDFPDYGKPTKGNSPYDNPSIGKPASYLIKKYLCKPEFGFKHGYGPSTKQDPRIASQLYALERWDAAFSQEPTDKPNLRDILRDGHIIVSNRYVESNIGHQGAKFSDVVEREEFMRWVCWLEYEFYKIPRPDIVILLDVHPDLALDAKRKQREKQRIAKDGHESDEDFIRASRETYLEAAKIFPNWRVVPVWTDINGLEFRKFKDIQQDIWGRLTKNKIIL